MGRGARVVEIGGALSGFQFVLSRGGASVWNVDPFVDYGVGEYGLDPDAVHARLNRYFRTDVRLCHSTLSEAALPSDSFDRIYCISTIEHLEPDELTSTLREACRILRGGGLAVLTVDLFLNLEPFTTRARNEWGRNISIKDLVETSGMRLVYGDPDLLYGFSTFDPDRIQANLERYFVGEYPTLTQLVVVQKEDGDGHPPLRRDLF